MTLSDGSKALNCSIQSTELSPNTDEGIYVATMDWNCNHVGNIG